MRSRSIEYQGKLLQDFSKEAMGKVFAKAKGEEGLDLVIHKVRLHLLKLRSLAKFSFLQSPFVHRSSIGKTSKTLTPRWNKPRTSEKSFARSNLEKQSERDAIQNSEVATSVNDRTDRERARWCVQRQEETKGGCRGYELRTKREREREKR